MAHVCIALPNNEAEKKLVADVNTPLWCANRYQDTFVLVRE